MGGAGVFKLALRRHDQTIALDNPGIFRRLINFIAELDSNLQVHLQRANAFKETS